MSEANVYLGLGATLGDRRENLRTGLAALGRLGTVLAVSRIYETEPVGCPEQPPFLNLACHLRTGLSPHSLLTATQSVERSLGRCRASPNKPRELDIDILLYEDLVLSDSVLTIPHPRMTERAFVLVPLADIAPELRHPRRDMTVAVLLRRLHDTHWVRPYDGRCDVRTIR